MPTPLKMAIINNMASCNMLVVLQHALINRVQARRTLIIVEHADINTLGAGLESGEDHRMSHGEGKTLMPKLLLLRGLS